VSAASISDLTAEKRRALLARLLRGQAAKGLPLSFAQERHWFLQQLAPDSHDYNLSKAVRLTGRLKAPALEQTLSEINRRHEILRTTYAVVEGQPVQVISPAERLALQVVGLKDLTHAEREAKAERLATDESWRSFNLSAGPVLRTTLLKLDEDEHVMLFTLHHIAGDGASLGVLIRELTTLYHAYAGGEPSPLPELPIQYADFAVWQRERLQGEVIQEHLAYWKRQLGGQIPKLRLLTDRPPPVAQTRRGDSQFVYVGAGVVQALSALGRKEGATHFMTLMAAFQTLLHRYTGQDEITIGSPISNRHRVETEPLIGCFINTVALRADLSGNPTFRQLLQRVREVTLGAYAHQDLPFEKLVQELQPELRLSPMSLFQVWFGLDYAPAAVRQTANLSGLKFSEVYAAAPAAQFDLTLSMCKIGEEMIGYLSYDTDLLGVDTVGEIIGHFQTLLEEISINPDRGILDIPIAAPGQEDPTVFSGAVFSDCYAQDSEAEFLFN
jgi:hypothetical protein